MDEDIAVMISSLVFTALVGSFVLLFPIARRLGRVLEEWILIRRQEARGEGELAEIGREIREVRQIVESVESRLDLLGERQDFLESLIEPRRPLIGGEGEGTRH